MAQQVLELLARVPERAVELWDGSSGLWAGALVVLATLLVSLTCTLGTLRTPQAPTFRRGEEVTKSISSETVSTATGSTESPRSPRSSCSEASVSCWPFKDLFAPCMGVSSDPSRLRSAANWNAEYKYGQPRSKLYSTTFAPINEDLRGVIQVAVPDPGKHEEVAVKLRRLRQLAEGLPGSGWVQPQDLRVLLRFLIARQLNVERALEMLQKVLHWRQQHGVSNALPLWDKALHERFDRYFKCLAFTGTDLDGDPVIVERCDKVHVQSLAKCSEDFLRRHVIYSAECVLASLERSRQESCKDGTIRGFQFTVVIDLEEIDMTFADRRLLALSKAMGRIESENYPEVLKRVIVVRAPWFFPAVFQSPRLTRPGTSCCGMCQPRLSQRTWVDA